MQYKIFGCKVNKYYTDKWLNSPYLRDKNGIFIASCVVTDKAKRKWLKFVGDSLKNLEKDEKIFISGCGAFKDGEAQSDFFELYPELSGNKDKIEILGEDPEKNGKDKEEYTNSKANENLKKFKNLSGLKIPQIYTKKFVLIQGGCDSFCTFCLTVKKRGRHFFRDKEDIVQEIMDFELIGGKEVVLTGVNLSAWGLKTTNDIHKSKFAELLEYILRKTQIERIRISSLGPEFIDDKCIEIFKNERIYPHFHFSVQSGSSEVLKNMARHYDGEYIKNLLLKTKNIKRDDNIVVSIGADLIVGFPGETEENFLETYNLVKNTTITKLHAFPFSPHEMGETVPAGIFKNQVDEKVKKDRIKRLLKLGEEVREDFIKSQKGKELKVLIESVKGDNWKGWTQNYIEANNGNFEIISGEIKRNEIILGKLK